MEQPDEPLAFGGLRISKIPGVGIGIGIGIGIGVAIGIAIEEDLDRIEPQVSNLKTHIRVLIRCVAS